MTISKSESSDRKLPEGTTDATFQQVEYFVVVPRRSRYLIEAIASDGSRRLIEDYQTEELALGRLSQFRRVL